MAVTKWRTWRFGAIIIAILIKVIHGYEEMYTISQLSPKSVVKVGSPADTVLQTSHIENLAFRIEPSALYDEPQLVEDVGDILHDEETEDHIRVARSAEPIRESRSINIDEIPSTNNEIDNELELHNKRKYYDIHPTKTVDYLHSNDDVILSSEGFGDKLEFRFPGEGKRVPFARALPPMGPRIRPTVVQPPIFATATHREEGRQNTEIQNIITGIVKLLNGNVNVQANTQLLNGRPRPLASRINNRGPPRISDMPPLPDFDKPIPPPHSFVPTKTPPPYPFDRPPVHVNLPEQIVPPLAPRPGLHRPMPPWQRPRPRPPNRRPNPGLPMYKPNKPIIPQDIHDSEEEIPDDVIVNENETVHLQNAIHNDEPPTPEVTEVPIVSDKTPETTTTEATTTESTTTSTTTTTTTQKPTTTEKTTTTEKPKTEKTTTEKPRTEKPNKFEKDKKKEPSPEKDKQKHKISEEKIQKENSTLTKKPEEAKPIEKVIKNITTTESPINKTEHESIDKLNTIKTESTIELQTSMTEVPTSSIISTPSEEFATKVTPILESTSQVASSTINSQPIPSSQSVPYHPYRPRPGIVLDDTDFKPHGTRYRPEPPVITAPSERLPGYGEIFDVTVSAIQGPGEKGASVHIETVNLNDHDDIIVSPSGEQGFVSIDGKRTYLNLFDSATASVSPTAVQKQHHSVPPLAAPPLAHGQGVAIPADDITPIRRPPQSHPHGVSQSHGVSQNHPHGVPQNGPVRNRPQGYRPQPTVRIDTCIVGDDSTCDKAQNEKCRTESGISSCQCRPGFGRRTHRDPCRRVISLLMNMRVDKIYDRKVAWDPKLSDKESEAYQQLSYEALRAIDSAFSMTPFSDDFIGGSVNTVHKGDENNRGVYVNYTVLLQETSETIRPQIATEIQKHMLGVIRRRSNNIGASALWVESVAGSVLPLHDLDECASPDLNDCHQLATCLNTWGAFKCTCPDTTLDSGSAPGRQCVSCPATQCSDRGTCRYNNGQPYCTCSGGYYGSRCEVDGEVVGVALGASLAAALVIGATLAALLSWSRKWSREQKAIGMGSPVFNYMASNTVKTPPVGQPPYQVTMEERLRWAQIAEAMVQANHYASEAQTMATRPSSAMFGGYPTLPPVPLPRMGLHHNGTMNTLGSRANNGGSHHNLYGYTNHMANESTSSDASSHVQDRADLLVPRPKSRARSMHNQTGIYYDVDYENAEPIYGTKGIPLSTYTISRGPPFYRA